MGTKVNLHLSSILWNAESECPLIVLEDASGQGFALPVAVGDASRLITALRGEWDTRTTSETSLFTMLRHFKARPVEVNVFAATQSEVYLALILQKGFQTHRVELSLADALCFSLRYQCPLTVSEVLWRALTADKQLSLTAEASAPHFYIVPPPMVGKTAV